MGIYFIRVRYSELLKCRVYDICNIDRKLYTVDDLETAVAILNKKMRGEQ